METMKNLAFAVGILLLAILAVSIWFNGLTKDCHQKALTYEECYGYVGDPSQKDHYYAEQARWWAGHLRSR